MGVDRPLRLRSMLPAILVSCSALGGSASAVSQLAVATPSQPAAVPGQAALKQTDIRIKFYQMKVANDPDFSTNYNRLASAYALKARETGDIAYLQLAESTLRKSLELESTHPDAATAFTQMATVHLAEHRFSEAVVDAQAAIKLDPSELSAYPYAGDAEFEQGNYDDAKQDYGHLSTPKDGRPHPGIAFLSLSRAAGMEWIFGQPEQASQSLRGAAQLAEELQMPLENVAWTHFMLGEQLFQTGDLAGAESEESASLRFFPGYHRALAEMGRIRAAQHRDEEAIDYYKQALNIIPLPTYAAALGDLYKKRGNQAEAEKQYSLVEYIGRISALNHQVYNRELATFYADHDKKLGTALELAQNELSVRHDVYTWDAVAWARLKNDDLRGASDAIEKALHCGTKDALLEYHAGIIYQRLGMTEKAAEHLQRAVTINPEFHVFFADDARRQIAALQEAERAGTGETHSHAQ
jgi:tetratricopeptide (TPR) repeat protein